MGQLSFVDLENHDIPSACQLVDRGDYVGWNRLPVANDSDSKIPVTNQRFSISDNMSIISESKKNYSQTPGIWFRPAIPRPQIHVDSRRSQREHFSLFWENVQRGPCSFLLLFFRLIKEDILVLDRDDKRARGYYY